MARRHLTEEEPDETHSPGALRAAELLLGASLLKPKHSPERKGRGPKGYRPGAQGRGNGGAGRMRRLDQQAHRRPRLPPDGSAAAAAMAAVRDATAVVDSIKLGFMGAGGGGGRVHCAAQPRYSAQQGAWRRPAFGQPAGAHQMAGLARQPSLPSGACVAGAVAGQQGGAYTSDEYAESPNKRAHAKREREERRMAYEEGMQGGTPPRMATYQQQDGTMYMAPAQGET